MFAHNIWGHSPDVPKALLLFEGDVFAEQTVSIHQIIADGKFEPKITPMVNDAGQRVNKIEFPALPQLDTSRIFIFKEKELKQDEEEAGTCVTIFQLLMKATNNIADAQARPQLLSVPRIQQALAKRSSGNAQSAHSQPPQKTPHG